MSIQETIREDLKQAMREHDDTKVAVLRSILSEFTNELLNQDRTPSDTLSVEEAHNALNRAAKQRKDAIEQFTNGDRSDLAEKEQRELAIIQEYLPEQLSDDELEQIVREQMDALQITDVSQIGQLMKAIMPEVKGRADGNQVKAIAQRLLQS
jgi:hypothetical protein